MSHDDLQDLANSLRLLSLARLCSKCNTEYKTKHSNLKDAPPINTIRAQNSSIKWKDAIAFHLASRNMLNHLRNFANY